MKLCLKVHKTKRDFIVAVCDKDILNKKLKHPDFDFHVNPSFYFEKEAGEEEVLELLKSATIVNLVGKKSVETGIYAGIVSSDTVIMIGKVPHAQMVKILQ